MPMSGSRNWLILYGHNEFFPRTRKTSRWARNSSIRSGVPWGASWFGGDDFAVFPGEQGQVPAFVFGADFLGHGFGGGLATGNKRGLLTGGS